MTDEMQQPDLSASKVRGAVKTGVVAEILEQFRALSPVRRAELFVQLDLDEQKAIFECAGGLKAGREELVESFARFEKNPSKTNRPSAGASTLYSRRRALTQEVACGGFGRMNSIT